MCLVMLVSFLLVSLDQHHRPMSQHLTREVWPSSFLCVACSSQVIRSHCIHQSRLRCLPPFNLLLHRISRSRSCQVFEVYSTFLTVSISSAADLFCLSYLPLEIFPRMSSFGIRLSSLSGGLACSRHLSGSNRTLLSRLAFHWTLGHCLLHTWSWSDVSSANLSALISEWGSLARREKALVWCQATGSYAIVGCSHQGCVAASDD